MAAPDDSALKALIDSNIPDATPTQQRRAKASFVRFVLYSLIDWVKTAINGNLNTWFKVGTASAPLVNTDDVYRTGKVIVGRGNLDATGAALQAESFSLGSMPWTAGGYYDTATTDFDSLIQIGTHCFYGGSWLSTGHSPAANFSGVFPFGALIVSRAAGGSIVQLYVENNSNFIYVRQKWQTNTWGAWSSPNRPADMQISNFLKFDSVVANRKVVLYDFGGEHQFYGFGVNADTLRYQLGGVSGAHIFYAGTTPATSVELLRIKGNGQVSIQQTSPSANNLLEIGGAGWAGFYNNAAGLNPNLPQGISLAWNVSGGLAESNIVFGSVSFPNNHISIMNWNGTTLTERWRLTSGGWVGQGGTAALNPSSMLHLKAGLGYQQFRLETPYTPTSTSDANGAVGNLAWDTNYIYVKTTAGWKRAALTTW